MKECVFCEHFIPNRKPLFENNLAIAYFDEFPVSKGHTLIITKRHAETFFDITDEEQIAIIELLNNLEEIINFLKNNKDYWHVEEESIVFDNNQLVDQYNSLIDKLA